MKILKIVIGIILAIASISVMAGMANEESGAGLGGAITGFLIIGGLAAWLIYSGLSVEKTVIKQNPFKKETIINPNNDGLQQLKENLQRLKESDIITIEEYNSKLKQINEKDFNERVKNTSEYLQLKNLYDKGFFDKTEFENKIEIIKNSLKEKDRSANYLSIYIFSNPSAAIVKDENSKTIGNTPITLDKNKFLNTEIKIFSGTKLKRFVIEEHTKDIYFDFNTSTPIPPPQSPKKPDDNTGTTVFDDDIGTIVFFVAMLIFIAIAVIVINNKNT